jgi:hypothetical protein
MEDDKTFMYGTAQSKKQYVMKKLGEIADVGMDQILIDKVDRLGWQAVIRTKELDFVFTYYAENCWKIESFPVYAVSGSMFRSARL